MANRPGRAMSADFQFYGSIIVDGRLTLKTRSPTASHSVGGRSLTATNVTFGGGRWVKTAQLKRHSSYPNALLICSGTYSHPNMKYLTLHIPEILIESTNTSSRKGLR
ncbi:hypothetical protein AB0M95_33445 [Sphaerisporangium sp. NPDC051017]|uniref:hypothetical protein n=1 Tax=Sphaerisporangium sp. NPDC051017 TaxID=3154636 RepID=UPI0034203DE3